MGGAALSSTRKKAAFGGPNELVAVAALAVALSREIDGRLVKPAQVARDAAELVAAMRRHFENPRGSDALPCVAAVASKYGLIVQPPRGRGGFRVMLESGTTFDGIPGLYSVA